MSTTIQSHPQALIESVARSFPASAQDDARQLLTLMVTNLTVLSPGGNLLRPGGAQAGSSAPPMGVGFNVRGGSGVFTVEVTNPATGSNPALWHEISYGPLASFTQNVTTMTPTTSGSVSIPAAGQSYFFRLRSSFDKKTWSAYQLASTSAIAAGLVESGSIAAGATFNQTNYGVVNSQASGSSAAVTVSGTGGNLTAYTAVQGSMETLRPSATIVGVVPQSEQFVAWNGRGFQLKPTLAGVLADDLEPVGKVSVVSTAAPALPTIVPIISGGGIVGYDVTNGGGGASQNYNLALSNFSPGTGATFGAQTIVGGVLISVAPGNAGNTYPSSTTVSASGGSGGGVAGGGTASGGNGGRLTAV